MKQLFFIILALFSSGMMAQDAAIEFEKSGITFSGDNSSYSENKQIVQFTGNVHFTTDIVEIEKADKIVYDRKTKTFTISGFKELRLHGKTKPASDFGSTTIKVDLGECVAYLIADQTGCPEGKSKDC